MDIGTKLDAKSAILRQSYLAPYGGWLGYVVILGSDLLGIWEFLPLALFVVLSWVVIRSATMEIALILGLAFDCAIPLQYRNDPARRATYETRLNSYWTTFLVGVAVEALAYCLLHPDLFTVIVAFKTLICTWMWMAKGVGRPALGGFDVTATTSQNPSLGSQVRNSGGSSSTTCNTAAPQSTSTSDPSLDWWMQMDERLEQMGYADRGGRCGMIEAYSSQSAQDEKEKLWKKWTHVEEKDALCDSYRAKLEASRAKSLTTLPKEARFGDIYQKLADFFPDPLVRWALMYKLRRWTDASKAKATLDKWLTEPGEIRRRTAQYRQIGLEKGALKRKSSVATQSNLPESVNKIDTLSESRVAGASSTVHGSGRRGVENGRRLAESYETMRDAAALDRATEEKAARQRRIMDNFQLTLEHYPEAFGEVSMVYIDMSVDGHTVRALVDSGARISVRTFAREAGLHDLIDTRWATVAHGVGKAHIIGRIHSVPIVVGGLHRVSTFYVIEGFKDRVLLGVDFLKRYRCVIDHARDGLHIETAFVPFVHAAELSRAARRQAAELQMDGAHDGHLAFRPESLKAYREKLIKAGYPKAIVPVMLDDMMDQPTAEAMQKRMNIFVNATGNPAAQEKVIQHYRNMKG